jgi:flagellar basal body-associated protein FliL
MTVCVLFCFIVIIIIIIIIIIVVVVVIVVCWHISLAQKDTGILTENTLILTESQAFTADVW